MHALFVRHRMHLDPIVKCAHQIRRWLSLLYISWHGGAFGGNSGSVLRVAGALGLGGDRAGVGAAGDSGLRGDPGMVRVPTLFFFG